MIGTGRICRRENAMVVGTLNLENLAKGFLMEAINFVICAEEQI